MVLNIVTLILSEASK